MHPLRGIAGFDFSENNRTITIDNHCGRARRINILDLVIHLWPGDWTEQLERLNQHIQKKNDENEKTFRRSKKISFISEREWWYFWGIIAACRVTGNDSGLAITTMGGLQRESLQLLRLSIPPSTSG